MKDFPGYVYVIRLQIVNGPVKIGMTYDLNGPRRRIREVSGCMPWKTDVLGVASTLEPKALESRLHRQFEAKRLNGEWFQLDEADIQSLLREADFTWQPGKPTHEISDEDKEFIAQNRKREADQRWITRTIHLDKLALKGRQARGE